jgi:signal transduction histidine kinase/CheY-like chemotaxis protein
MNEAAREVAAASLTAMRPEVRGRLFRKYVALVVSVVCVALLANGLFGIWISYREQKASLVRIQREQAGLAAAKIGQFIKEIEGQLGWMTQLPSSSVTLEERRIDGLRLLRQIPAITELALLDESGREELQVSRVSPDVIASQRDRSREPAFVQTMARKVYYGPVYFRRGSEPYLTVALAGSRRDAGVSVADVNLIYVWDVVSQIKAGANGKAYVLDAAGRLIAHPDISLVLRNTDFSRLKQVQLARAQGQGTSQDTSAEGALVMQDVEGRQVLTAHAVIAPLGWLVFVEQPIDEAYASVYASLLATGLVLLGGLVLAVLASLLLARKMVTPIRTLQAGAARIGTGALDHRIEIKTGDELQALGDQFNKMAAQLQESYSTLEHRVKERTHDLELANLAKSRFLAAASHDLRQPLHALNLFIAQLSAQMDQAERDLLLGRIHTAVAAMNELFSALLDISKLDAGVLAPSISEFPVNDLFGRIETTFMEPARQKGLRLRIVPNSAWIRSDVILLERVLLNLVSNAVRYTDRGGMVIGCRRQGTLLRIDVCDTGIGIPDDQRRSIFGEFYRLAGPDGDRRGGLGLGLAIVDRLCGLLDHPIDLASTVGRGSRFSISVPLAPARLVRAEAPELPRTLLDGTPHGFVLVIDDDPLVCDGMRGLLQSWGYRVAIADSENGALSALAAQGRQPDLIISDYRLARGKTGFEAIERLHRACGASIPAFLISGDTAPERLREASASGYQLLHKPVSPMTLRAIVSQLVKNGDSRPAIESAAQDPPSVREPAASPTPAPTPQ